MGPSLFFKFLSMQLCDLEVVSATLPSEAGLLWLCSKHQRLLHPHHTGDQTKTGLPSSTKDPQGFMFTTLMPCIPTIPYSAAAHDSCNPALSERSTVCSHRKQPTGNRAKIQQKPLGRVKCTAAWGPIPKLLRLVSWEGIQAAGSKPKQEAVIWSQVPSCMGLSSWNRP